ncbi:hypothetical protein ACFQS1_15490 [Paractinoplanes rhizophilus]|jgi:hypothetical protein|uniref:Uncharacterized protein n=1 Tax=Paractinoplanes rhizophilus TaxID=1416877 RepID=A0ABW2HRE7_9ACTN|nr:hypothetical protein [Actinoplanes sp.]
MTAPGNSALVFTLLAVFLACSGYAAGRLHQRYQMERDRQEAYRDGYDMATRSIFSLAARLVAPRRAPRSTPRPIVDGALVPSALSATPPPDAALPDTPLSDPARSHAPLADPALADPALADPALSNAAPFDSALSELASSGQSASDSIWPAPGSGSVAPGHAGLLRRSGVPGALPMPSPRRAPTLPERHAASLGFPVPPRPPAVGPPTAKPPAAGPSAAGPSAAGPFGPFTAGPAPDVPDVPPSSPGRHTVPEELVQAETYRLPPDRVFRAKVPDPADRPALPEEPTTRLGVPKPRNS